VSHSIVAPALYRGRNAIDRTFCRLKDYRRIATRYDKLAANFLSAVHLAADRHLLLVSPDCELRRKPAVDTGLFRNAGIGASSGETPATIAGMAANAVAFIKALGIGKTNVLGYSIGGKVAQEIAVQAPDLVRKLVLVGTGPRGAVALICR
jgi:hypothetical protein